MTRDSEPLPAWYYIVAIVLGLWSAIGCYFCFMQFIYGADAMRGATDYDHALMASLPDWYNLVFALAVIAGLLGAIALLGRSAAARILFLVSLIAALVQFGYLFAMTDVIAQKGAMTVLPFPVVIIAIGFVSVWFAGYVRRNEWVH